MWAKGVFAAVIFSAAVTAQAAADATAGHMHYRPPMELSAADVDAVRRHAVVFKAWWPMAAAWIAQPVIASVRQRTDLSFLCWYASITCPTIDALFERHRRLCVRNCLH